MPPQNTNQNITLDPSTFLSTWRSHPDPTALPFPKDSPPFELTPVDWQQLSLTDDQFTPHTWEDLARLIEQGRLDELKRWPSALKAYLAWTGEVKSVFREKGIGGYLLGRLGWTDDDQDINGTSQKEPLSDPTTYTILHNDWPYAMTPGIQHVIIWSKVRLPVDEEGFLTERGREVVEGFVARVFRERAREKGKGEKVVWFRNPRRWQSVRGVEHVHVLVRGGDD